MFFRQQRIGEGGRPFVMLKFRTMQVNADPRIHQQYVENFIQSSGTSEPRTNVVFKIVNDPRVTPVGHFLRRSSLDEFPQFWNVLKGEMSLVGPRPPLPYEVARYKAVAQAPAAGGKTRHYRSLAGDGPQPHDLRRNGAPRSPLRQNLLGLDRRKNSASHARALSLTGKGAH